MRKLAVRLRLSRETLRELGAAEIRHVAGQVAKGGTAGSCTYFVCEPSNPWPCNETLVD